MGPYRHPAAVELVTATDAVAFDDDSGDPVAPMVVPGTRADGSSGRAPGWRLALALGAVATLAVLVPMLLLLAPVLLAG